MTPRWESLSLHNINTVCSSVVTQKSIAITTRKLTMNALHLGARFAWCNQAVHPTFLGWYREALMCFETGGHCAKIWPAFYHPSHTRIPSRRATGGHYITQNSLHINSDHLKIQSTKNINTTKIWWTLENAWCNVFSSLCLHCIHTTISKEMMETDSLQLLLLSGIDSRETQGSKRNDLLWFVWCLVNMIDQKFPTHTSPTFGYTCITGDLWKPFSPQCHLNHISIICV